MPVHNIRTPEEFTSALKSHNVVVLDFFATWCSPCKVIAPKVVEHSNEDRYKDIFFAKIDVDELPDLCDELKIHSMPTLQLYRNGQKADELVDPKLESLEKLLEKGL